MDIGALKETLQEHFTDGLVVVVGSGLSAAEGIPGMGPLADYLYEAVSPCLGQGELAVWEPIAEELKNGVNLEVALSKSSLPQSVEDVVVQATADCIRSAEAAVLDEVLRGGRTLRFSRLLKYLLKTDAGIPVVTTNYDRLIEVATEFAGLGIDSLFVGAHYGKLDTQGSQHSLCRGVKKSGGSIRRVYAHHIVLLKPHGSLDWTLHEGQPVRCQFPPSKQPLIITPGIDKFRGGYDQPYDVHRERANREIDKASRYLILGYGFNDDHLQTHLEAELRAGKPAVLLTRSMTDNATALAEECPSLTAIFRSEDGDGTTVTAAGASHHYQGSTLWDLGAFIEEVFEP